MRKNPSTINFVLDDEIHEVDFEKSGLKPTTTLLNYLRSLPNHKGVKEGCAEGDCGACTVVVASLNNRGILEYQSIDSCLVFLPMIHGKQVITVENLAKASNGKEVLHPVQQAMVKHDGSQCGYCTPGIVMSLFALYKNHDEPNTETISDALTGNLCRCTGYQPIVNAGHEIFKHKTEDHFSTNENLIIEHLNRINEDDSFLDLSNEKQRYLKPFSLGEALHLRKQNPEALIVGGSTDIALLQTKKRIHLPEILDISAVKELDYIVEDHSQLAIGPGTSMEELHLYAQDRFPYLYDILKVFGSLQIRNMATIGGNIGSASPIGDLLPVLISLESKVRLMSIKGSRDLSLEDFIVDYRKTAIRHDELIGMISFRKPQKNELIKSYKVSRRKDLDISSVSACFRLTLDDSRHVKKAIITYGGMAATPKRAIETEQFLGGRLWNKDLVMEASKILLDEFQPISDARSSAEARRVFAANLLIKFWDETKGESELLKPESHEK